MGKTKQITLNLTEEQQSILRMALIDTKNTVSRLTNYDYDNDEFYLDLLKQVYNSTMPSNGYSVNDKNYEPWNKFEIVYEKTVRYIENSIKLNLIRNLDFYVNENYEKGIISEAEKEYYLKTIENLNNESKL